MVTIRRFRGLYDSRYYTQAQLNSTIAPSGASLIGVSDAGVYFTSTNVEAILQELMLTILPGAYLRLDGTNIPTANYNWTTNLTTTGTLQGVTVTGTTSLVAATMTLATGSITDTTGAISFGNENLTTTGWGTFDYLNITDETVGYQIDGTSIMWTGAAANFNMFLGEDAFDNDNGARNIGIGYQAGYNNDASLATIGRRNVYIGHLAGYGGTGGTNNTGYQNVAIGDIALYSNTTGLRNFALGSNALAFNQGGDRNVAIGYYALRLNISGDNSIAIGNVAGYSNTSGDKNVNIGDGAGRYNETGDKNTNIGFYADGVGAGAVNSHSNQTCIGATAGYNNTTGGDNIYIGYQAGYNQTVNSNRLIIDNRDRGNVANELTNALIYGFFAATTALQWLRINANVGILTNTFGTNADGVLGIHNGTVPTTSPVDMIQIFSTDIVGNDATLGLRTEAAVLADADETKFSNKLPVRINGATYYIMLTTT